eukprot:PhF_6_TR38863/c0_g1_i2/m.58118
MQLTDTLYYILADPPHPIPSIGTTFLHALLFCLFCFAASVVTSNDSWVDRLWSIIPVWMAWVFALEGDGNARTLYAVLITMWGIRLTYNFYRRGGYRKGGEDYRWNYVRTWPLLRVRVVWIVFNLIVIAFFQGMLLWLITIPLYEIPKDANWEPHDAVLGCMFVFFLSMETTADQQQWVFQQSKRNDVNYPRTEDLAVSYQAGFRVTGLFRYSRHPNVFAEQMMWVVIYLAGSVRTNDSDLVVSFSVVGCATLVLLTISSTILTEYLSSQKYPAYRQYQSQVPMLAPKLWGKPVALKL